MPADDPIRTLEWTRSRLFAALVATLYVGSAAFRVYDLLGRPTVGMDDANIFFVYARNFIHGHGIVYSVGGAHVEGFTSMAYFLLCSAFFALTDAPEPLLLLCNGLFAVASTALMLRTLAAAARAAGASQWTPPLAMAAYLAWVCCNPAYLAWAVVSLMDTGLYGLLVVCAYNRIAALTLRGTLRHECLQISLLLAALVLVRPEALAWALALLAAYACLKFTDGEGIVAALRRLWPPFAVFSATALAMLCFRLAYFGQPLPNTYYAKVSSSVAANLADGWQYLTGFTALYGTAVWLPLVGLISLAVFALCGGYSRNPLRPNPLKLNPLNKVALLTAAFAAIGLALPVLEGGDHFFGFRLFQPAWPLLGVCVILPLMLPPALRPLPRAALYLAVCTALLAVGDQVTWARFAADNSASAPFADADLNVLIEFRIAAQERLNGARLSDLFAPNFPTIGFGSAGGIAYGYQGRVEDMMGLNDTRMAHADTLKAGPKGHESFNKRVFYQIAPDVLMPRAAPMDEPVSLADVNAYYTNPEGWDNVIFKGLYNDPEFRAKYVLALVGNSLHPQYKGYGYFNRTYLSGVLRQGQVHLLAAER